MIPHLCIFICFLFRSAHGVQRALQGVLSFGSPAANACHDLSTTFPNQTLLAGSPQYHLYQSNYWSVQQSELAPSCRFLPLNAKDVRIALENLISNNASFAVVSGGHSSNTGASNIDEGVTIDLSSLHEISLTADQDAVWIGPGARWSDVYAALEPHGLTVAGARVSHVGVGGFVLGGGLSWHANQVGWSCDSVLEFEVVTPDLRVLRVSRDWYVDLFWALKGSLGAFGLVTGIKMRTIQVPETGIYAGAMTFRDDDLSEALTALAEMAVYAEEDEFTTGYLSFGYLGGEDQFTYNAYIVNTAGHNDSSSLRSWHDLPHLHSSLRYTSFLGSAKEISDSNPLGLRRSKFTITTVPNLEVMIPVHNLFRSFALSLSLEPEGLLGMTFQALTRPMLRVGASPSNPNIFSETLVTELMPFLLVSLELWWSDSTRDAEFEGLMEGLEKEMLGPKGVDWAKHPWVYPNYAARWQEPLQAWRLGESTAKRMREIKAVYDPEGVWEKLVPGLWHV